MNESDELLTIAELAIALAGFASVAAAFHHRSGAWEYADVIRLRIMIEAALSIVVFALLPIGIFYMGASGPLTWALSSTLLALLFGGYSCLSAYRVRGHVTHGELIPSIVYFSLCGSFLMSAMLALNAMNIVFSREYGPYIVGLIWGLFISGVMFLRLVTLPIVRSIRK